MFSTIFHELRNHLEFHLSCRNSGSTDFFFSSYFHFSMDPSLHKWVKIHDAFSSLPYISLYFSPQGMSVTLLSISTNGYRACLISWLLLSHLELSLDRMLYWLIVLYLFFFFHYHPRWKMDYRDGQDRRFIKITQWCN